MATYGHTFTSGDTVTPTKLNNARTVTDIVNADIKSDAAIAGSKIDPSFNAPAVIAVNSASTALRVTQEGAGNALVVEDSTNPDSTPLVVNNLGQIISGATTAFDSNAGLQITSDLTTAPNANIVVRRCHDSVNAAVALIRTRGTAASQASVQSGDSLGVIQFFGYNGTSATNVLGARILARLDAAPGASDMPSSLQFSTNGTERMRITSAGNVGIGTTTPATALDVNGTVTATAFAGPLTGNVTGDLTGTASAIADGAVTAAKLDGAQTGSAPIYGCRAWVNFDGTVVNGSNECTIRGSGNITKVVRNTTGDYTVTMQTAMPDTNYAITGSSGGTSSTSNGAVYSYDQLSAKTTTTFRIATLSSAGSPINTPHVMVMVIR